MNTIMEEKYTGDGGVAQRNFIKDAQVGWKAIVNDPQKHLGGGVSQYDYMESLLNRLGGQARRVLSNVLDRWDFKKDKNPNILNARAREEDRKVWKTFRMDKAVYNLGRVHMVKPVPNPTPPDERDDPIDEPEDLEEFITAMETSFQSASASFFDDLKALLFRPPWRHNGTAS